jgi:hypothetical protein
VEAHLVEWSGLAVGQRVRCPICKRADVEVVSAPMYATGRRLADHALPIWFSILGRRCPMSGAAVGSDRSDL